MYPTEVWGNGGGLILGGISSARPNPGAGTDVDGDRCEPPDVHGRAGEVVQSWAHAAWFEPSGQLTLHPPWFE